MKPPPMPPGLDELTLDLVEAVRQYDRNCRCPRCMQQALQCTECDFCQANLQKLFLRTLTGFEPIPKPAASFSSCQASADHTTIALMKKKAHSTKKLKKLKASATKRAVTGKKKTAAADDPYAKRIFIRFDEASQKELVRKAAKAAELSLSRYCALAAVYLAKEGWKPELKPEAVENAKAAKAS